MISNSMRQVFLFKLLIIYASKGVIILIGRSNKLEDQYSIGYIDKITDLIYANRVNDYA